MGTPPDSSVAPSSHLHYPIIQAWAACSNDPAEPPTSWLLEGAPAGIAAPSQRDGLLEPVGPEDPTPLEDLCTDAVGAYSCVEADPEALKITSGYIGQGWLKSFDSAEALA